MPPAANIIRIKWAVVDDVKKALPAGPFTFHLAQYIAAMEIACRKNPQSADLLACLGIALALNHDTQKSVECLQRATQLDPTHFFVRLKLAGLFILCSLCHQPKLKLSKLWTLRPLMPKRCLRGSNWLQSASQCRKPIVPDTLQHSASASFGPDL